MTSRMYWEMGLLAKNILLEEAVITGPGLAY